MPEPTRQEILDAHAAVTTLARLAEEYTPVRFEEHKEINDLHLAVRAALPPRPQPTMADVAWDDEKYYLAEATHPVYETVLMLGQHKDGTIKFFALNRADSKTVWGQPEYLTLTGKRYTLTEVQE